MSDQQGELAAKPKDDDLFLIEIPGEDEVHYLICERIITLSPKHGTMDVPWHELAGLFRGKTLRAVPMPGKFSPLALRSGGVSTKRGSTSIEINIGGES